MSSRSQHLGREERRPLLESPLHCGDTGTSLSGIHAFWPHPPPLQPFLLSQPVRVSTQRGTPIQAGLTLSIHLDGQTFLNSVQCLLAGPLAAPSPHLPPAPQPWESELQSPAWLMPLLCYSQTVLPPPILARQSLLLLFPAWRTAHGLTVHSTPHVGPVGMTRWPLRLTRCPRRPVCSSPTCQ